jgi:hypothetical protein
MMTNSAAKIVARNKRLDAAIGLDRSIGASDNRIPLSGQEIPSQ